MRLANLVCFLMAGGPLVPGDESEKDTMAFDPGQLSHVAHRYTRCNLLL